MSSLRFNRCVLKLTHCVFFSVCKFYKTCECYYDIQRRWCFWSLSESENLIEWSTSDKNDLTTGKKFVIFKMVRVGLVLVPK